VTTPVQAVDINYFTPTPSLMRVADGHPLTKPSKVQWLIIVTCHTVWYERKLPAHAVADTSDMYLTTAHKKPLVSGIA
ncbi:MAG TPA: hypothetical protein VKY33_05430, partial [Flavobacterium sp.]|nr:hypothetical protein [Flavobacterium sp.]